MFSFGDFELAGDRRVLRHKGRPVALRERAVAVLEALVEKPGEVVSKRELCRRAWPERDVGENNLQVEVLALRRVLGKDAIVTASGRGYQFTLPVARRAAPATVVLPLVGREADLAALAGLVMPGALVTLTGEPGIGKTALARGWVGAREVGHPGSTSFVALDGGADPRAVLAGVERRRAAMPTDLLVLDGCDDVLDAASAFVQRSRDAGSRAATIVTTREVLRIADERVYRVQPLSLSSSAGQADAAAVRLFREALAGRDAVPDTAAIGEICKVLEGHPLAVILAARRAADVGVHALLASARAGSTALLDAIEGGPDVHDAHRAGPPGTRRHGKLQRLFEASIGGLSPFARAVWRTGALLPHPFTLADLWAAPSLAKHDQWDVADALAQLVDRSLVATDGGDPPRYRLSAIARHCTHSLAAT